MAKTMPKMSQRRHAGEGEERIEAQGHAGAAGDAFAAFEADEDAIHVPQDGREADQQMQDYLKGRMGGVLAVAGDDPGAGGGGKQGLEQIQDEDVEEEPATQQATDVGGADVARAGLARIDAIGQAHHQAEGDRAQQVGQGDQPQEIALGRGHRSIFLQRRGRQDFHATAHDLQAILGEQVDGLGIGQFLLDKDAPPGRRGYRLRAPGRSAG